ncbi:glutathione S-transferase C-terminal domain-containing protein [Sphingomonas sp.]
MWRQFVDALDERLADRPWIAGDAYSFADITALITIDFARSAKLDLRETAGNVARWYEAASVRPSASA